MVDKSVKDTKVKKKTPSSSKNTQNIKSAKNAKNSKSNIKNKNKGKKVLITFLTLLILSGLSFLAYFLCTSPSFGVAQILVEGNSKYTTDEIIQKSGIVNSKNIFLTSSSKSKKSLKELPYINDVKIVKKLPNTVDIVVTERVLKYFAYDKDKNTYYRLDNEGVILEQANIDAKTNDELLTYGITFDDNVELGKAINESDLSKLVVYEKILSEFEKSGINMGITRLNFENSLTTIVLNDKLSIVLPNDTNLEYNMIFLKNIIANIGDGAAGVIDMTKNNPTFSQTQ